MKKSGGNKIKLGIFVSVGLFLLIAGVYYIGKKQQMFSNTFDLEAVFKDINGLQVGDNVRFAGINVGVVENIEIIADTSVMVDFDVQEKIRKFVSKDAKATIGSDGLMGNKILIISPGASKQPIRNYDIVKAYSPINTDDVLAKLQATADNAALISADLSAIMGNISKGRGTIGKLFMDTTFANNISQTVVNIKQGAGGFKRNMDAASHSIFLRGFLKKKAKKEKEANEKKEQGK